jgi:transposase
VFHTRDLAVRQPTHYGNAIRGHLAEYGWIARRGTARRAMLADQFDGGEIVRRSRGSLTGLADMRGGR